LQPILAKNRVRNVPAEGLWSWNPGSYFGMYHPDTFWLDGPETR
jgi:peptide/nickel transport system substrate-binding protein